MTIEDNITSVLAERERRSSAKAPTLEEIELLASADVRVEPDDGPRQSWERRSPVLLAVAAAVVLVVLVAGALVLRPGGDGEPVTSGPAAESQDGPASTPVPLGPLTPLEEFESAVCRSEDKPTFVVLFHPDASAEEITQVGSVLDQVPDVERVELFDQAAVFHEFTTMYADSPEVLEGVTAEQMRSSYRIWAGPGWDTPADLSDMAGIGGTVTCN